MRPTFTAYYSEQIQSLARSVYQKQRQLGPRNLAKGLLIREWESLQNVCTNNKSTTASNIEWSSRVISVGLFKNNLGWKMLTCAWIELEWAAQFKEKRNATIVLDQEVEALRRTRLEYDSQQLLRNIDTKKGKTKNHTIYKWLNMLRHRKEEQQRHKQHDQTNRIRAQPITNWCKRD